MAAWDLAEHAWLWEDDGSGGSSSTQPRDVQLVVDPVKIKPGMQRRHKRLDPTVDELEAVGWLGCEHHVTYEVGARAGSNG